MRDCANVEMRDALPELVHDRLPRAERERVLAHVSTCVDCAAEVALLRGARRVLDRGAPAVDAAAIARAVQSRLAAGEAGDRSVPSGTAVAAPLQPAWASTRAPRSRWASRPAVRALAASLVVALGLGGAVLARRDDAAAPVRIGASVPRTPVTDGVDTQVASAPAATASSPRSGEPRPATVGEPAAGAPTLALGETFADLDADELAAVIDAVSADDARLPVAEPASDESLPLAPATGREGGNP